MTWLVDSLGYVALGTPDLDASERFYRDVCQLQVSERRDGVVFLTGDARHHWLRLEQRADAGLIRVGYQVVDAASKVTILERLEQRGVAHTAGGTIRQDRVAGAVRFADLHGIEVELYDEMVQLPVAPPTAISFELLLHAVFLVPDVVAAREFWEEVLGFRRSDQIEEFAMFMRCGNQFHHSLAFLQSTTTRFDHLCMQVADIDDVVRMCRLANALDVPLERDLVRHTASGSISTYLADEALNIGVEFCTGHPKVPDDDRGRLLVASAATVDLWAALPGGAAPAQVTTASRDQRDS